MEKMSAKDKRYAAIKVFSDKWRPESNGYRLIESATADDMIAEIEDMHSLGRTKRWHNAITAWVKMMREYPENLEWAVLQGGIYASMEAE